MKWNNYQLGMEISVPMGKGENELLVAVEQLLIYCIKLTVYTVARHMEQCS